MEGDTTLETRDMPALEFRAEFSPDTLDTEKRTVDLTWTTGARVKRGFWDTYWEELSLDPKHVRMDRLNNGAPFLDCHNGYSTDAVIGVVESARLEPGRGVATVRFAKDDERAERIFRKVKDKILRNVSVGYRVHRLERDKDAEGDDDIPVMRAVDWEPHEISVVPIGADDGAGFRSANAARNPCVVVMQRKAKPMEGTPTPAPATAPVPPADAPEARSAAPEDEAIRAAEEKAAKAERERVATITDICKRHKLDDDFSRSLIDGGVSLAKARTKILDELARRSDETAIDSHLPAMERGEDERDKFVRGASAWLFERAGVSKIVADAAKAKPDLFRGVSTDPGEFRGLTLLDMARECLERSGVKTRGMDRMKLVGAAFTRAGNYQTVSDFAVLLENVMNKTLLAGYAVTPDTWSRFCKADTVPDFRPSNRYRTGYFSVLDSLNEQGEFKNKAIPDGAKLAISADTKGNIVALSRKTIINDDMSALADTAQKLGRAAALSIETDVYALLAANSGLGPTQADSQPFFHSNRANVNATGSAITVAGINADSAVMAAQKDPNSVEYLDLRPAILLTPWALYGDAVTINDAQFDPADNKFQKPNYCRGMFREVIRTPRLTGTRRYLFADTGVAPAIVVAFLEGQGQSPVLESERGWRVDGVEWKVRLDYKAQMFDPKGAVTNAGA